MTMRMIRPGRAAFLAMAALVLGGTAAIDAAPDLGHDRANTRGETPSVPSSSSGTGGFVSPTPVQRLDAAMVLAEWALEEGDALALVATARASMTIGGSGEANEPAGLLSPSALLGEAARLRPDDAVVAALIAETLAAAPKGVVEGPTRVEVSLAPGERKRFDYVFAAGEIADAVVRLRPDQHGADLDLVVFDAAEVLVAEDAGPGTGVPGRSAYVQWRPDTCAPFTVEITNASGTQADFLLASAPAMTSTCERER